MASLLESFSGLLTPETVASLSEVLGIDETMIGKGAAAIGPLLLKGLADKSQTTAGLDEIMKMLPDDPNAVADTMSQVLSQFGGEGAAAAAAGTLDGIFGAALPALGKSLSGSLGFDVTPLLGAAAPMLLGLLKGQAGEQKLDSAGIAQMLQSESRSALANLEPEVTTALDAAGAAGEQAQALRDKFSDDDWSKIQLAPLAVTYYVMSASPSGMIGTVKELTGAGDAVRDLLKETEATSLLNVAYGALGGLAGDAGFDERSPRSSMLEIIQGAAAAVKVGAADEAPALADLLNALAKTVAEAAKEGGFLGIGAKLVSKDEEQALAEIRAALA